MILALRAKDKLGFINSNVNIPIVGRTEHEKWMRVDSMVSTWTVNSILKELIEAFLYTNSAKDIWLEFEERFGESNESLVSN